jgi:hypothetical protein
MANINTLLEAITTSLDSNVKFHLAAKLEQNQLAYTLENRTDIFVVSESNVTSRSTIGDNSRITATKSIIVYFLAFDERHNLTSQSNAVVENMRSLANNTIAVLSRESIIQTNENISYSITDSYHQLAQDMSGVILSADVPIFEYSSFCDSAISYCNAIINSFTQEEIDNCLIPYLINQGTYITANNGFKS